MKQDKKKWIKPSIEEVALEAEEDVLATCYTASHTTRSTFTPRCTSSGCATYP